MAKITSTFRCGVNTQEKARTAVGDGASYQSNNSNTAIPVEAVAEQKHAVAEQKQTHKAGRSGGDLPIWRAMLVTLVIFPVVATCKQHIQRGM